MSLALIDEPHHGIVTTTSHRPSSPVKMLLISAKKNCDKSMRIIAHLIELGKQDASIIDLSEQLSMPIDQHHIRAAIIGRDGTDIEVQRMNIMHDDFPDVMKTLIENSLGERGLNIFVRVCETGHKADVVSRAEAAALNRMTGDGPNDGPWPLFEVRFQSFSDMEVVSLDFGKKMIDEALEWLQQPEAAIARPPINYADRYGATVGQVSADHLLYVGAEAATSAIDNFEQWEAWLREVRVCRGRAVQSLDRPTVVFDVDYTKAYPPSIDLRPEYLQEWWHRSAPATVGTVCDDRGVEDRRALSSTALRSTTSWLFDGTALDEQSRGSSIKPGENINAAFQRASNIRTDAVLTDASRDELERTRDVGSSHQRSSSVNKQPRRSVDDRQTRAVSQCERWFHQVRQPMPTVATPEPVYMEIGTPPPPLIVKAAPPGCSYSMPTLIVKPVPLQPLVVKAPPIVKAPPVATPPIEAPPVAKQSIPGQLIIANPVVAQAIVPILPVKAAPKHQFGLPTVAPSPAAVPPPPPKHAAPTTVVVQPPTPPQHVPLPPPPPRQPQPTYGMAGERWVCCAHGNRTPTIEMWREVLQQRYDVDWVAMARLICLAQASPQGFQLANRIVDKLLKCDSDGRIHLIRSTSRFITRAVENARRGLNPEGEVYAGMGGHGGLGWDAVGE
jgi:hypothetical protein